MKVFKFGGASISTVERMQNVAGLLQHYKDEQILIVISAMGKTTNALEKVAEAFFAGRKEESLQLFQVIKKSHLNILQYLVTKDWKAATERLEFFFTEVEWLLHDRPVKDYNYYYDQIVCCGELLSTSIMSSYLNEEHIDNNWIDVRDVLRTDDNFRDANVDNDYSVKRVDELVKPLFTKANFVITQGFIGSTDENETTTLGREGSDYSAALFANMLDADSLTIWKDVKGVMNADPKEFKDATFLASLSYEEVIEMAYYGAQVIHPKTIKPLENKNIPLHVKCFTDPASEGTVISKKAVKDLPPIIVMKQHQVMMKLSSKDFSFVGEKPIARLYEIFADLSIRPNLTQNGAINLLLCLDDKQDKIEALAVAASELFDVQVERELWLLTIRHYNDDIVKEFCKGKDVVLEQKTKQTIQLVVREEP